MKTVADVLSLAKADGLLKLPPNLHEAKPLREQGLDSLDLIMLLSEVETVFEVRIPQEQTTQLRSLQDIVDFLNANP